MRVEAHERVDRIRVGSALEQRRRNPACRRHPASKPPIVSPRSVSVKNRWRSAPAPPTRMSWPGPPISTSLPAPPSSRSLPRPPSSTSLPDRPNSWSSPRRPVDRVVDVGLADQDVLLAAAALRALGGEVDPHHRGQALGAARIGDREGDLAHALDVGIELDAAQDVDVGRDRRPALEDEAAVGAVVGHADAGAGERDADQQRIARLARRW